MYIAIEKIPDGGTKMAELALTEEGLQLCNVYEDENGKKVEEILGEPILNKNGYQIGVIFTDSRFWQVPSDIAMGNVEDEAKED